MYKFTKSLKHEKWPIVNRNRIYNITTSYTINLECLVVFTCKLILSRSISKTTNSVFISKSREKNYVHIKNYEESQTTLLLNKELSKMNEKIKRQWDVCGTFNIEMLSIFNGHLFSNSLFHVIKSCISLIGSNVRCNIWSQIWSSLIVPVYKFQMIRLNGT